MPHRSVTILSFSDGHDAGAALIRDGNVIAALQEERPTNIKHYDGMPEKSLHEVFRIAKIHPSEVDLVAVANLVRVHAPVSNSFRLQSSTLPRESSFGLRIWQVFHMAGYVPFVSSHSYANLYVRILHKFREMKQIKKVLGDLNLLEKEVVFVEHHLAHAASAYRSCPWSYDEPTLVLTADGAGDCLSSTVSVTENGQMKRVASSPSFDSLGNAFYGAITVYLGLRPWFDEYKTMGLAPYGNPRLCYSQTKRLIKLSSRNNLEFKNTISPLIQTKLQTLLGRQRFDNIAAAAQLYLEDLLTTWVKNAADKYNVHNVACAGGIFLNVKANKRVMEMEEVEKAFFYPAAGDDGTTVGAGLEAYFQYCLRDGVKPEKPRLTDLYYGPEYSVEEVEKALKRMAWMSKAERYDSIESVVGNKLSKGKVVARFNGRMEWGPRALGNRSILADPRDLKMVRKINFAIKHRDFWMPFAPTILESRLGEYVEGPVEAPYMILAFDTTNKRDEIVAAIHQSDLTCRPQTLGETFNPAYKQLIETFESQTGVGGVLNTSFNLHGYPIVQNPELALWTFENSGLDGLALGDYYISR